MSYTQKRESDYWVSRSSGTHVKSVAGTITTTGTLTVWTPASGKKFRILGISCRITVTTILAGTGTSLWLVDNAYATVPLIAMAGFAANQAAGSVFSFDTPDSFTRTGLTSGVADRVLKLEPNATISTGVLAVSCLVWGREV